MTSTLAGASPTPEAAFDPAQPIKGILREVDLLPDSMKDRPEGKQGMELELLATWQGNYIPGRAIGLTLIYELPEGVPLP